MAADSGPIDGIQAPDAWLLPPFESCGIPQGFRHYNAWWKDGNATMVGQQLVRDDFTTETVPLRNFLILRGTGIAALRAEGQDDLAILHQFGTDWKGRATRLDLAVDVKHPKVTPHAMEQLWIDNRVVNRFPPDKKGTEGTPDTGYTLYLRTRDLKLRIYDKSRERARKGFDLEEGVTRFELELHRNQAKRALKQLLDIYPDDWDTLFPAFVQGLLLSRFRPLDGPKPDRNPQRAPLWTPFKEALDGVAPVRLGKDERDRNAAQRLNGQLTHFANARQAIRVAMELVGPGVIRQWAESGHLDPEIAAALEIAKGDASRLKTLLSNAGLDLPTDDQEDELLWR